MARKYYAWKDPACGGIDIKWTELTGTEFYAMMRRPENKGRRFIRLGNAVCADADIIIIEATEEAYTAWKREQNTRDYLARQGQGVSITSLDSPPQGSELESLHEAVGDERVNVERAALSHLVHEQLEAALKSLEDEEAKLLVALYIQKRPAAEIARELGVHRSTVIRRAAAALERLQKFF